MVSRDVIFIVNYFFNILYDKVKRDIIIFIFGYILIKCKLILF